MNETYKVDEIREAYYKLKTYVYYDRSDLFQRSDLVYFETDQAPDDPFRRKNDYKKYLSAKKRTGGVVSLEQKLEVICEVLNGYNKKPDFFNKLIGKISINFFHKKIRSNNSVAENYITNKRIADKYEIERASAFIDLSTELSILNVLWIMRYGYRLDAELDKCCVGNRLVLNKERTGLVKGTGLFKPYYKQYQKWRDESISEAKKILVTESDAAFINLDLKDYFYSVHLDLKKLDVKLFGENYKGDDPLHEIFKKVHIAYTEKLIKLKFPGPGRQMDEAKSKTMLPVGLLSSYILANWYLKDFDTRISQKIRPAYYGRYVDDILIVFKNPDFEFNEKEVCENIKFDFEKYKLDKKGLYDFGKDKINIVEKFMLETFYPIVELITIPDPSQNEVIRAFKISCVEGAVFQSNKTLLYYFDHKESSAAVDKLKQEIEERASEFRDFPEDDVDELNFDDQAYHLIFDGSEGKIRTLKDYKENRYGLSVFLANRIFVALRRDKKSNEEEVKKIINFFKGLNVLEYYRLWEKLFTYFIVNDNPKAFLDFYKGALNELVKLSNDSLVPGTQVKYDKIFDTLITYFAIAVELALSLTPDFLKTNSSIFKEFQTIRNLNAFRPQSLFRTSLTSFSGPASGAFRKANMVRHDYVVHPLFNYVFCKMDSKFNLVNKRINTKGSGLLSINEDQKAKSPRKVHLWECCIYKVYEKIINGSLHFSQTDRFVEMNFWNNKHKECLDEAFELYEEINIKNEKFDRNEIYKIFESKELKIDEEERAATTDKNIESSFINYPSDEVVLNEIRIEGKELFKTVKISFANSAVNNGNIEKSLKGKPNLDATRYSTLADILKQTRKAQADVLIFPECYLPYELVPSLAKFSAKNQIAVVTGLEHWNVGGTAYNFIVTILPFEYKGVKDSIVLYRLKNHYSHAEELMIRGYGYKVPKPNPYKYNIFNWKGLYFAPFYCFELADIKHRSLFRSKVDLLIISEWNKDVNYFSNIIDSLSRDVHAYIAQVNTSQYGDSRLAQPKETAIKDILKLKGGINDTILVGEINLVELREFQLKYFELSKDCKSGFKPVPPEFERDFVSKRIENKNLFGA